MASKGKMTRLQALENAKSAQDGYILVWQDRYDPAVFRRDGQVLTQAQRDELRASNRIVVTVTYAHETEKLAT